MGRSLRGARAFAITAFASLLPACPGTEEPSEPSALILAFDVSTRTAELIELPTTVLPAALVALDDKLVAFGGTDAAGAPSRQTFVIDPATHAVTVASDAPVTTKDTLPVVTGVDEAAGADTGCFAGDEGGAIACLDATGAWAELPALPSGAGRAALIRVDGITYAFGGTVAGQPSNLAWRYDANEGWIAMADLPTACGERRRVAPIAAAAGKLLMLEPCRGTAVVEQYDVVAGTWSEAVVPDTVGDVQLVGVAGLSVQLMDAAAIHVFSAGTWTRLARGSSCPAKPVGLVDGDVTLFAANDHGRLTLRGGTRADPSFADCGQPLLTGDVAYDSSTMLFARTTSPTAHRYYKGFIGSSKSAEIATY
jgi:hypothetical protein